jgi:hypothetical protein
LEPIIAIKVQEEEEKPPNVTFPRATFVKVASTVVGYAARGRGIGVPNAP